MGSRIAGSVEVAEEGRDYDMCPDGAIVCKAPRCIKILRDLKSYKTHARSHNLHWRSPRSQSQTNPRRKQLGAARCPQYNRQRGTVEARWNAFRERKRRSFISKSEEYLKCRASLRPEEPKATFVILVLEKRFPKCGYQDWGFLLDDCALNAMRGLLEDYICDGITEINFIWELCFTVESHLGELDTDDFLLFQTAISVLKAIFAKGSAGEIVSTRVNLLGHRKLFVQVAQEWLHRKVKLLMFDRDFKIVSEEVCGNAVKEYEMWAKKQKPLSLATIQKNLEVESTDEQGSHEKWANPVAILEPWDEPELGLPSLFLEGIGV